MTPKYYEKIRAAQTARTGASNDGSFDFSVLKSGGIGAKLAQSRLLHSLLRSLWPVGRIGRFAWAVRHADVVDLRSRPQDFHAPYWLEMRELTGGADFALGMQEGPDYRRQLGFMRSVMRPSDIDALIAPNARRLAEALLLYSGGEIDAVEDLLLRVAVETCADYFGLELEDPIAFSQWLMSISALLFADYLGDPRVRQLALNGAARVRKVMDAGIRRAHGVARQKHSPPPATSPGYASHVAAIKRHEATLVGRLVDLQIADPARGPGDDEIRAMLIGMSVGYVPTGAGAGGNILEVLLQRPEWLREASKAARTGNDARLKGILREAMRFSPPINPGVPRHVAKKTKLGRTTLPEGTMIVAASMAAMFDPRAVPHPGRFDPDRTLDGDLQFGGPFIHYCVGELIADALLMETFKPLLVQEGLRRAADARGRMVKTGPFPHHLHLSFRAKAGQRSQSMTTICVPVTQPVPVAELHREIDRLGNPARPDVRDALNRTGVIHFAHISAIEAEKKANGKQAHPSFLIVELNTDGSDEAAIAALVGVGKDWLMPLFTLGCGITTPEQLQTLLAKHVRRLVAGSVLPGRDRASGLNFMGTPELAVSQIEVDEKLAASARVLIDEHVRRGGGATATAILKSVREQIRQGPLRAGLVRPRSKMLAVSRQPGRKFPEAFASLIGDWRFTGKLLAGAFLFLTVHYLASHGIDTPSEAWAFALLIARIAVSLAAGAAAALLVAIVWRQIASAIGKSRAPPLKTWAGAHILGIAFLALVLGVAHFVLAQGTIGVPVWDDAPAAKRLELVSSSLTDALGTLVIGLILLVLAVLAAGALFLALLRKSETTGPIEDFDPPFDRVKTLLRRENPDDHAQNHIIAVTPLKTNPRWLRRLTLALAFWGIEKMVVHQFRPGFVLDIGTIHFARWFRLPGTDKLVFLSNYDGSWESYLEDFITKAARGQTAVWSNGIGFPATRFLLFGGAADGARFKRWVRRQQVETRFWYSRFPMLTTSQIRTNAMIGEGLAKACTDSDAQAWLELFGSQPRPNSMLEYDEIQTILFNGMGGLKAAELVPLRIPEGNERWREWMCALAGVDANGFAIVGLGEAVAFGETAPSERAATVAFSAEGLRRMGLDKIAYAQGGNVAGTALDSFPNAFVDGMASEERGRILGDRGESASGKWAWGQPGAMPHAVLILYAKDGAALREYSAEIRRRLTHDYGLAVLPGVRMQDMPENFAELREPFGFHDGISQPVMRGTQRFHEDTSPVHAVEPGEFILGYADNRGETPPSPVVSADADPDILQDLVANLPSRFPDFRGDRAMAPRDLGRNGSYLVIRQLEQDVAGFNDQADEIARHLAPVFRDAIVDRDWVAARMVGRWKDGSSLARNPYAPGGRPDNDFLYGAEDPQGTRCPYSSHIRRAFPRDSLSPDHKDQLGISNRHRLLRRGRPYVAGEGSEAGRGILFMCLNADLERQFEFVQQTWISSADFHGQTGEVDAIAASRKSQNGESGTFTIQSPSGPASIPGLQSYVTVRNGGYFFLPSRAALRFFASAQPSA